MTYHQDWYSMFPQSRENNKSKNNKNKNKKNKKKRTKTRTELSRGGGKGIKHNGSFSFTACIRSIRSSYCGILVLVVVLVVT